MEMHQLRYFLAVLDEGNFTRAAAKSFVSQPSLSAQIIKLEEELGSKLFDRLGRRASATEAGKRFARRARNILLEAENAKREVEDIRERVSGSISIGVTPSVGPFLLPPVIRYCRDRYPELVIRMEENLRSYLLEALIEGQIEIAVSSYRGGVANVAAEPLLRESLYLAVRDDHPLAKADRRVSIQDLKDEPMIVLGESGSLNEKVYEFFGRNEMEPIVAAVCSQVRTAKALVESGLGMAVLPSMAREPDGTNRVVFKPLISSKMSRLVFALTYEPRYLGANGRAVLEALRHTADSRDWG